MIGKIKYYFLGTREMITSPLMLTILLIYVLRHILMHILLITNKLINSYTYWVVVYILDNYAKVRIEKLEIN